jgi:hypothetical protein
MPTITQTVNNDYNAFTTTSTLSIQTNPAQFCVVTKDTGMFGATQSNVLEFQVSGLANGSNITSAKVQVYGGASVGYAGNGLTVNAIDASNPSLPPPAQVANPTTINVFATPASVTWPSTTSGWVSTLTNKSQYYLQEPDVTDIVSGLVSSYDYSSGESMIFFIRQPVSVGPNQSHFIYQEDWGATKAAKLVIVYEVALSLVDKTTYVFK